MTSPWRVLDLLNFSGRVTAGEGSLQVAAAKVALVDIAVMIVGVDVDIHSSVFDRAAATGFPIMHCDWRGVPTSVTWPWSENTRVGARHVAQADLPLPRRKNAWMRIVRAKIRGQASNLRNDEKGARSLIQLAANVRSGDPSNCEGQAARLYWTRLFEDRRFRRVPRTGAGLNGMLDYGYTILRGGTLRSILAAGLWPSLGVWHRNRGNVFALADDLIEPFRPAVDALVLAQAKRTSELDTTAKRALAGVLDLPLATSGYTVGTEVSRLSQSFGRYVEGLEQVLEVPCFGGLDEE